MLVKTDSVAATKSVIQLTSENVETFDEYSENTYRINENKLLTFLSETFLKSWEILSFWLQVGTLWFFVAVVVGLYKGSFKSFLEILFFGFVASAVPFILPELVKLLRRRRYVELSPQTLYYSQKRTTIDLDRVTWIHLYRKQHKVPKNERIVGRRDSYLLMTVEYSWEPGSVERVGLLTEGSETILDCSTSYALSLEEIAELIARRIARKKASKDWKSLLKLN